MPPSKNRRRLLILVYAVIVAAAGVVVLEMAARQLGLGDPVLYYNAAWGGMRPLPDQQVRRLDDARVTVDANGFRTAQPDQAGGAADALRVLYLGDSVTWGGTALDDSTLFSERAADVLRAGGRSVYAMNAGVNGTSLMNQADIYHGLDGRADVVVWIFPWADVRRTYATAGALWPARLKPRFALVELGDHLIRQFWLPAFRRAARPEEAFARPDVPVGYEAFYGEVFSARTARNLDACRAAVRAALERGTPIVMGVTPRYADGRLAPLPDEADAFLAEMERAGVRIFDVGAALQTPPGPLAERFVDAVHYSAAGHAAVGRALGRILQALVSSTVSAVDPPPVPPS